MTSQKLASQIAQAEQTAAPWRQRSAETALAAANSPDDPELRQAASDALAELRAAEDRLAQLRSAVELAQHQEREAVAEKAAAERAKLRARLQREHDRLCGLAAAELEKEKKALALLDAADDELEALNKQLRELGVKRGVFTDQRDNATRHYKEYSDQSLEIEERLADLDDPSRVEARKRAAEEAAAEEVKAEFDRRTAAELAALAEAAGAELVEIEPFRRPPGIKSIGWLFDGGFAVKVPRRDLARVEALRNRPAEPEPAGARGPSATPWRYLQGPPHCLGLAMAVKTWLRTDAGPGDVEYCLEAARAMGRQGIVALLQGVG